MECHLYVTGPGLEVEMVLSFFGWLCSILARHEEDYRLVWSLSKKGQLEVRFFFMKC
jgi:hypothetical protein